MALVIPKEKYIPAILKVLDLLTGKSWEECDIHNEYSDKGGASLSNVARNYSITVKNCLINHRYTEAAALLRCVGQELSMVHLFFFKAAAVVLENDEYTTKEDYFNFIRLSQCLKNLNKSEVLLEYLMYILKTNDEEGYANLKVLLSNHKKTVIKNDIVDPLLKAYVGLLEYIEWSKNRQRNGLESSSQATAQKAIDCFKEIIELPGQWDIFIVKLVEMLEFNEDLEQAEAVLTKYVEVNPEHLNAYIYLCTFLLKHDSSSEKLSVTLKAISKKSPSDPLVLHYCDALKANNPKRCLKQLFHFLDYPVNSDNVQGWKMLFELITQVMTNASGVQLVNACWSQRRLIWPYVHFNTQNIDLEAGNYKVIVYKAAVLHALIRSHHPYVKAVFNKLKDSSKQDKLKTKLITIDDLTHRLIHVDYETI